MNRQIHWGYFVVQVEWDDVIEMEEDERVSMETWYHRHRLGVATFHWKFQDPRGQDLHENILRFQFVVVEWQEWDRMYSLERIGTTWKMDMWSFEMEDG